MRVCVSVLCVHLQGQLPWTWSHVIDNWELLAGEKLNKKSILVFVLQKQKKDCFAPQSKYPRPLGRPSHVADEGRFSLSSAPHVTASTNHSVRPPERISVSENCSDTDLCWHLPVCLFFNR